MENEKELLNTLKAIQENTYQTKRSLKILETMAWLYIIFALLGSMFYLMG